MESHYVKKCARCGDSFTTANFQKLYCQTCGRNKSRSRSEKRASNILRFVGVDGEGVDRPDGKHEYVMLSVGERTLWQEGNALTLGSILSFLWERYCEDPEAVFVGFFLGYDFIQWEKLLPESVAYSLLTTKGIAGRKSQRLSRSNPYPDAVVWETWEIDIMAGRRFKLRPHVHHRSAYNSLCRNRTCREVLDEPDFGEPAIIYEGEMAFRISESDGPGVDWQGTAKAFWQQAMPRLHSVGTIGEVSKQSGWMYICDTGPFWQTSFLKVIDPKGWDDPVCSESEFETVVKGKADRGTIAKYGSTDYFEEMRQYNILENDILARVTERLNRGFMSDEIPIALKKEDWYGPGRAAQTWIDMLHTRVADHNAISFNKERGTRTTVNAPNGERQNEGGLLNADVYMSMPSWFYDAARASYYGGWFEQFVHGHCGNVWEYDINSAYPYVIASLPCLHTTGIHNGRYSQGRGNTYPTGNQYTLLYGTVRGSNAYIGAMPYRTKQGNILRPHITKGWYWAHEVDAAKRAGLVDTMEVEEWGAYTPCLCSSPFNPTDIGIERMYQIRLEAGKNTPQGKALKLVYNSAYGKTAQSIGSPKYSNPVYASLITAGCRTLILDAIAMHPKGAAGVTMVATDGLYVVEPFPDGTIPLSKTALGMWDGTLKPNMTQLMPGVYWDDNTRDSIKEKNGTPKIKSRGVNAKDLAKQIDALDSAFARSHNALRNGGVYDWPSIEFKVNFLLHSAKLALQRGKWETAGKVEHGTKRKISSNPISKRVPEAYRDDQFGGLTRTRPYERGIDISSTPYHKAFGFVDETDLYVDKDGSDGMQYFRDLLKG